jgi:4-amino-4-deoxy-L-arabinose transferase-like glycosyltransferase
MKFSFRSSILAGLLKRSFIFFSQIPSSLILVSLNIFAIIFYFFMLKEGGYSGNIDKFMFSARDACEYRDYINFLTGHTNYSNPNRPFFYPLLLLISRTIDGTNGIWIMQFIFWLISCNLSFLSVQKMQSGKFWAVISFLLMGTYLSAIFFTAHALTEITVLFLLSILTYIFSSNYHRLYSISFGLMVLLVFSILFAVKPFFQIPLVVVILLFIIYHRKRLLHHPIYVIGAILCLLPALIQCSIYKTQHNVWNSGIEELTLRHYLVNKVDYYVTKNTMNGFGSPSDTIFNRVREKKIDAMTMDEVRHYLLKHIGAVFTVGGENISENVTSPFPYIKNPEQHHTLIYVSGRMNVYFCILHIVMFFLMFFYFLITIGKMNAMHFYLLSLGFVSYLSLIATSISFWQGDRLVVPSMAVWCVIYPVFISHIARSIKERFSRTQTIRIKNKQQG